MFLKKKKVALKAVGVLKIGREKQWGKIERIKIYQMDVVVRLMECYGKEKRIINLMESPEKFQQESTFCHFIAIPTELSFFGRKNRKLQT